MTGHFRKIICALDTSDLDVAINTITRLKDDIGTFKVGHALTLTYGLDVVSRLQDAGAERIFLDLKFHDIPNSVALAVREAAKRDVWMITLHTTGGPAMMIAAMEEARSVDISPLIVGVSVLTSLDQQTLTNHIGVNRTVAEQIVYLSKLAMNCDLDGVVCSAKEIESVRQAIGSSGIILVPGIRPPGSSSHDQARVGTAQRALADGADYLVVGRALTEASSISEGLESLGLSPSPV